MNSWTTTVDKKSKNYYVQCKVEYHVRARYMK